MRGSGNCKVECTQLMQYIDNGPRDKYYFNAPWIGVCFVGTCISHLSFFSFYSLQAWDLVFLLLPGTSLPVLRILLVATLKRSREDPSTGTGTDWYGTVDKDYW